ncbi:MAG: ABC transporter permease [Brevefilum sp.]|nr:ABC transporter permease [Brevefilum sp.]
MTTIYDSAKRKHPAIEELKALWQYRDLVYQLVRRDIVARYKRSVLGVAWTMLNPLGIMLVMTFVFSQVFSRVESYPAYLLTGLICWNMFNQSTSFAMNSMVWGSKLLQQIYLPNTSFVVSTILANMVNFLLSLIPLFVIMLITGVPIKWTAVLLPIAMVLISAFSLGVGLLMSTLAVFFPDVAEIYPVILRAWMYMTPIIVPVDVLEKLLNGWVLRLNPLYYIVNIFRHMIYYGSMPSFQQMLIATLISFGTLIFGWIFFSKRADKFSYHV